MIDIPRPTPRTRVQRMTSDLVIAGVMAASNEVPYAQIRPGGASARANPAAVSGAHRTRTGHCCWPTASDHSAPVTRAPWVARNRA